MSPWLQLVTFDISVMILKSVGLTLTISVSPIFLYAILWKNHKMEAHLRSIGIFPTDVAWVEENALKHHTQQIPVEDLFLLLNFIHFCYFSDSQTYVSILVLCLLMSTLFCLFWPGLWNIQWRWSLYVSIWHDLWSCDGNPMWKKIWLYVCTPQPSGWWFGLWTLFTTLCFFVWALMITLADMWCGSV